MKGSKPACFSLLAAMRPGPACRGQAKHPGSGDQARRSSTSQAFFYGGHQVVAFLNTKHANVSHAMLDPIVFLAQILNGSHTRHRVHLIIAKLNTALSAFKAVFVEKYANIVISLAPVRRRVTSVKLFCV